MLLWYAVLGAVGVWAVFDSPAVDYRMVMAGAVLPVSTVVLGRPGPFHSLLTAVVVLVGVMAVTSGRRLVRRRWLGLPIGLFAYLVLSGTFADTDAFWWPLTGLALATSTPPELARGALSVLLEIVALGVGLWWYRRVGLDDAAARAIFRRSGQLPRSTASHPPPPIAGSC